jgi:hypothetical protein
MITRFLLVLSVVLSLTSPPVGVSPTLECGKLLVTYDEKKDESLVQLRPLIIEGVFQTAPGETLMGENSGVKDEYGVAITALYSYPGKTPSKPQAIMFVVEFENTSPTHEKDQRLSLNLNGEILDLGLPERRVERTNMGLTREDLSIRISYEALFKFAGAKKATLSIGPKRFTLTECHLEALRKFARNIPT